MRDVVKFFRANPQVFVLLLICVVLGLGTFLAVLFGLITAGPTANNSGEPSGAIVSVQVAHAALGRCVTATDDDNATERTEPGGSPADGPGGADRPRARSSARFWR